MPTVVIRPAADVDLLLIWDFIARDNPSAADNYLRWLADRFDLLATQPLMGKAREELKPKLRSFVVGRHIIFYMPFEEGIAVERVLAGPQDSESIFAES
ncbi:hypothetical protein BH24DEI1_BH24DEI1_07390 [soil metagenome]|jgi:toxin ParE1/3/4|nr:type II toxin-antitoxin system RelE/ParE family toxin [Deinococcota bacterium]